MPIRVQCLPELKELMSKKVPGLGDGYFYKQAQLPWKRSKELKALVRMLKKSMADAAPVDIVQLRLEALKKHNKGICGYCHNHGEYTGQLCLCGHTYGEHSKALCGPCIHVNGACELGCQHYVPIDSVDEETFEPLPKPAPMDDEDPPDDSDDVYDPPDDPPESDG